MNSSHRQFIFWLFTIPVFFQNCGQMESIDSYSHTSSSNPMITQLEGQALYQKNCAGCHGAYPDNRTYGASFDQIKSATIVVSQMNQMTLEDSELQLIADYLQEIANPTANNQGGHSNNSGGSSSNNTATGNARPGPDYEAPSTAPLQQAGSFGESGMQRLTKKQLIQTLELNLGVPLGNIVNKIPVNSDSSTFFENDYKLLSVTMQDTNKYSDVAKDVSKIYSLSRLSQDAGCTPQTNDDRNCFEKFLRVVGRRFLRRPVTNSELTRYSNLLLDYSRDENRFMTAVEMALEALAQHPEFLYRIEAGTSQTAPLGLTRLSNFEVATRMAFLITGRGPSDDLLNKAASGQLNTPQARSTAAEALLKTNHAKENWKDFHGQWLGYRDILSNHPLQSHFSLETDQLIEKVLFTDNSDWTNIFTSEQTYLTPELAKHYNIPGINQAGWVNTTGRRKSGLLSHAKFASVGAKFGDTSPTLRGYEFFKRVFCGELTGSIPSNVDVTEAPGNPNDCKPQRYAMSSIQSCQGCHAVTDGIGFGLEGVDQFGRLRDVEVGKNTCNIDNKGTFKGTDFLGPDGLADILAGNPYVGACATKNVFEFMMGRNASQDDEQTLKALEGEYYRTRNLQGIIKAIVSSEGMVHRREL